MNIEEVLLKAISNNIPEGHCYHCRKPIQNYKMNKKFCSELCKHDHYYWGYTKPKFMNHKYMRIYLGFGPSKGVGRLGGGGTRGAMGEGEYRWSDPVPLTRNNIENTPIRQCYGIMLANEVLLKEEEALILADYLEKLNV